MLQRSQARSHRLMSPIGALIVVGLVLLLSPASSEASITSCANPAVTGGGLYQESTTLEAPEGSSTCDPLGTSKTRWFEYTATCDGELRVATCNSSFDTILSIHSNTCPADAGTQLAGGCNDSCAPGDARNVACSPVDSCLSVDVTEGETVLIRATGVGVSEGTFNIEIDCAVPNDRCEAAPNLIAGTTTPGSTRGAMWDNAAICDGFDNTSAGVWYTVVGNGNNLMASLCNGTATFDSKISVYCAGCGGQQCVTANDDSCGLQSQVSWCSTPGEIYHILVHGYQSETGPFDLQITDTGTNCGPFYANCSPANDTCATALPFVGGVVGDNTSAGTDGSATCQATGGDVWFQATSTCHGKVTYDTCAAYGTLADTVLSVQDSCGGTELACSDDAPACGLRSAVTLSTEPGREHFITVADYSGDGADEGTFLLNEGGLTSAAVVPTPGLYVAGGNLTHLVVPLNWSRLRGTLLPRDIRGVAWAPGMGVLFGLDHDNNEIVAIDPNDGSTTLLSSTFPGDFRSLAWDPVRLAFYSVDVTTTTVVRIEPFTGRQELLMNLGTTGVEALTYRADTGILYAWDLAAQDLIIIDPGAPSVTWAGGSSPMQIKGIAWHQETATLHAIGFDSGSGSDRFATIDPVTGAVLVSTFNVIPPSPEAMTSMEGAPPAVKGQPYSAPLPISGGCPVYTVANPANLPAGLTLNSSGVLSGTPTAQGYFLFNFDIGDINLSTPIHSQESLIRIAPDNDFCANPLTVTDGATAYSTEGSTTDGPDEPIQCNFQGDSQVWFDTWHSYQATCTGNLTVGACTGLYDSKLAVYGGTSCPMTASALACDDDSCGGTGAQVTLPVAIGQDLLIRVGGWEHNNGSATLDISCVGTGGCCGSAGGCAVESQQACTAAGGVYLGEATACSPDSDGDGWNDTCDTCPNDPNKSDPGACGCGAPESDLDLDLVPDCIDPDIDGDGVPNETDWEPLNRFACNDTEMDSCDDCSSGGWNWANDGPDFDGDGWCDLGDCSISNPSIWWLPGEVLDLAIASDTVSVSWNPPSESGGGQPLLYDLIRWTSPADFSMASCMATDITATQATDIGNPAVGTAYYYLVSAQNGCGEGGFGVGYPITPRFGPGCP